MLQDLNVVEILRAGLSGLCFLLSLLAFWLIRQEQNRVHAPRKGILRIIYLFMAANLVTALLVGGLGYLNQKNTANAAEPLAAKTYLIENTSYLIDLTRWTASTGGPAVVRRSDFVKKVSDATVDFVIPSYTNGDGIDWKPISFSTPPTFTEIHAPDQAGKHAYEYRLPLGREPKDHFELVASEFTFPSGFKNPKSEWWKAYVPYPSHSVSVVIRFPAEKPCRHIAVFREEGIRNREPITDNLPLVSNGGQVVMWTGLEIAADTRIEFDWDWDQSTL